MVTISHNVDEVIRALDDVEKRQIPQALVWAYNDMAYDVLRGVQDDMGQRFDRPTRFAKNAFMVLRATKQKLVAEVKERPDVGRKHFLKIQEAGGQRPRTAMETAFNTRMAFAGHIQSVIPAAAALRDAFGNWSAGERNRVMSAVRAQSDRHMNSPRAAKVRSRSTKQFFVPRPGSRLSSGVWKRTSKKAKIRKVLHFSQRVPAYKPRLGFVDGAYNRVNKNFPGYFARSFQKALNSAR